MIKLRLRRVTLSKFLALVLIYKLAFFRLLLSQVLRHKGEVYACATFVASLYFGFAVQLVAAFLDDGHAVVVELFGVGVDADESRYELDCRLICPSSLCFHNRHV